MATFEQVLQDQVMLGQTAREYAAEPVSGHPVHGFGRISSEVDVEITAGGVGEYGNIHEWFVRVRINDDAFVPGGVSHLGLIVGPLVPDHDFEGPRVLARMTTHSLDLWHDHSITDAADADSGELEGLVSSAFTSDNEPLPALDSAMARSGGYQGWTPHAVMTIDTFVVAPKWRGTALTPYLAALVLSKSAALGRDSFIVHAHPIDLGTDDGSDEASPRSVSPEVHQKIAGMWRAVGFVDYDDQRRLAGWFPDGTLMRFLDRAEHRWPYLGPEIDDAF